MTWLVAIGTNLSALWILIANGWMQIPVGAAFNPDTMRMELTIFCDVLFNPVAQAKFVHTVSAGYVTGSMFVLAISAWYLLQRAPCRLRQALDDRRRGLRPRLRAVGGRARRRERLHRRRENQKMKLAAIEAMWDTEPAPAGFTCSACPTSRRTRTAARSGFPGCSA